MAANQARLNHGRGTQTDTALQLPQECEDDGFLAPNHSTANEHSASSGQRQRTAAGKEGQLVSTKERKREREREREGEMERERERWREGQREMH